MPEAHARGGDELILRRCAATPSAKLEQRTITKRGRGSAAPPERAVTASY